MSLLGIEKASRCRPLQVASSPAAEETPEKRDPRPYVHSCGLPSNAPPSSHTLSSTTTLHPRSCRCRECPAASHSTLIASYLSPPTLPPLKLLLAPASPPHLPPLPPFLPFSLHTIIPSSLPHSLTQSPPSLSLLLPSTPSSLSRSIHRYVRTYIHTYKPRSLTLPPSLPPLSPCLPPSLLTLPISLPPSFLITSPVCRHRADHHSWGSSRSR